MKLHAGYHEPLTRSWNEDSTEITPKNLMYPVFIHAKSGKEAIPSLSGQFRYGIDCLVQELTPLVALGLGSVLLFGVNETPIETPIRGTFGATVQETKGATVQETKDETGSFADSPQNPVTSAIRLLRSAFPRLLVACDVCLCAYTSHGHCGILTQEGKIDNQRSIARLAEVSLAFARAGCQLIAPSDMMDGRVYAIKQTLEASGYGSSVPVMSYSAKFASAFYGPFRNAAGSGVKGDRKCYQLPCGARGLAHRALKRDVCEGADILMVKPGYPYLDIVRDAALLFPDHPLAIYQVSGEYAMLDAAAAAGHIDLEAAVLESLCGARRAGATILITYFTPLVLEWIRRKSVT